MEFLSRRDERGGQRKDGENKKIVEAEQLVEGELLKREEVKLLQQQTSEAEKSFDELLQQHKEEYMKQKAMEGVKTTASDHFAEHKDKLNAARGKLNKYKNKYEEVGSVKELPKNPLLRNPLKGKPLSERFILGSIWQFHKENQFKLDLAPSLAYQVTDKIEMGIAYQWRISIDKNVKFFLSTKDRVQGYRLFSDYKLKKGFFIRGSVARLYYLSPQAKMTEAASNGIWVNSYVLGAGKNYTFYKSIKGYSIIQYNFSSGFDKPYKNPIQVKIGFYINGKNMLNIRTRKKN